MDHLSLLPVWMLLGVFGPLFAIACSALAEQLAGATALVFRSQRETLPPPHVWRVAGFVLGPALVAVRDPVLWTWVAIAMAAAWTAGRIAPLPAVLRPLAEEPGGDRVRGALGSAATGVVLVAGAVWEWPVVRHHVAGAVLATLIATVAIRRPWRFVSSRRLLIFAAGLGFVAAHEAWHVAGIPAAGWHVPVFTALTAAIAGCIASEPARRGLLEAIGLKEAEEGSARAAARVSRIAVPSALAGGFAGMAVIPVEEARWLALGALAMAAEFGRRRMAPLTTREAMTTLGGASSALTGFLFGWLSLVPFAAGSYAAEFGYEAHPDDVIGPDDWIMLASSVGACIGYVAGYVFEGRRIPRGVTATRGLAVLAIGSIAATLSPSFVLVALSFVLAGAGAGAAASVVPNEVRERIRDIEGGAADDALLIVALAAAVFLGGIAAHFEQPDLASIVTAAVAVGAGWAFRPALRSSDPPGPSPNLRALLKDRHLLALVAVLGLNYTVLVPSETKAVAVFSQWDWGPLAIAGVLTAAVLPGALVSQLGWSRLVRTDHLKAAAIAGWLSIGTLVVWTIGLLLEQPTATLVIVIPAVETVTTLTFMAIMQALLGERGNVRQWSFANTAKWGVVRPVFTFAAAIAFARGPGTGEWRLVAISAPLAFTGAVIATVMHRNARAGSRPTGPPSPVPA